MTDIEAVDFLKKARIYLSVPRGNAKQITQELYIEAMTKAINALEEKTKALPLPDRPHGEWEWGKTDYFDKGSIYCTNCRTSLLEDVPEIRMKGKLYEFCPNCGADMRVKEVGD